MKKLFKPYKKGDYKKLKIGEKLCIIDFSNDWGICIPSILENDSGILKDYINSDLNNIEDYSSKEKLDIFEKHRESAFIDEPYIKLSRNDDLRYFIDFWENSYIFQYIKEVEFNHRNINAFKINKSSVFPSQYSKNEVNCKKSYIKNNAQTDKHNKDSLFYQKFSIIVTIFISFILGLIKYIISLF